MIETTADSLVLDLHGDGDGLAAFGDGRTPRLLPFVHRADAAGCAPAVTGG